MTALPNTDEPVLVKPKSLRLGAGVVGLVLALLIAVPCFVTLPWSLKKYDQQHVTEAGSLAPPSWSEPFGTDLLGRSLFWRCLTGGAISLSIGISAAVIAVVIGVTWGAASGYAGGRTDAVMMRIVDVLYGLPSILIVVLIDIALRPGMRTGLETMVGADTAAGIADIVTLMIAISGVSWLTMSRVVRGQVLSLRGQPFIEAARACGVGPVRIFAVHLLPNLLGPIIVYTTLTVPAAILQESFLSFLGIGVQAPLPSWGNLAAEGLGELHGIGQPHAKWWLMFWPCALLALTLTALNFLGDALRARMEPRKA